MSASTEAAARAPGTAQKVRSRAPSTSPPTEATGRSTLIPSRTKRRRKKAEAGAGLNPSSSRPRRARRPGSRRPASERGRRGPGRRPPEGGGHGGEVVRRHEPGSEAEPDPAYRRAAAGAGPHGRFAPGASPGHAHGRTSWPITTPAPGAAERRAGSWIAKAKGLPSSVGGSGVEGGSSPALSAVRLVRHWAEFGSRAARRPPPPPGGRGAAPGPPRGSPPSRPATARFGQGPRQPDSTTQSLRPLSPFCPPLWPARPRRRGGAQVA